MREHSAYMLQAAEVDLENRFMRLALCEAVKAQESGDVPVGAVIVRNGQVVAKAHNTREKNLNVLGHAEISAIDMACKSLNKWRLDDCDLYVTLEPCFMCTGAILEARIRRVYFGAYDRARGYIVSNASGKLGVECYCGIMEQECAELLMGFFDELRK